MKTLFFPHWLLSSVISLVLTSELPLLAEADKATSVQPAAATAANQTWPLVPATPLDKDSWYHVNTSIRGLAGLTSPKDNAPVTWETSQPWIDYSKWLDGRWIYLEHVRLAAMRTWATSHLGFLRSNARTVFYPFSGPDVLYVDNFFPNSKYLLMAGLEPVGVMPDLAGLQHDGKLGNYLEGVKTSLNTILAASFFKTKDMKNDFNNGLMPAIAVFLGRQGYSIDSIQYVSLGKDGMLQPRAATAEHNGVQITYFAKDRDDLRVLLYFRVDLGNDGVTSNPGFVNLMQKMGPGVTYLKAASYLLHEDYFSSIKKAILKNSVGVLEDDSGLPLRAFGPEWTLIPCGNYTGPISLFKDKDQPDMKALFTKVKPEPLPFGSGYKYRAAESSLLIAEKH